QAHRLRRKALERLRDDVFSGKPGRRRQKQNKKDSESQSNLLDPSPAHTAEARQSFRWLSSVRGDPDSKEHLASRMGGALHQNLVRRRFQDQFTAPPDSAVES